jgi:hypothetical protein
MKKIFSTLFFLTFPFFNHLAAQDASKTKEKIGEAIAQYFDLDRETIHAHFDKKIFLTDEEIWFKGYVFNKKNGTPFFETTNVFAVLIDDDGKIRHEQLLFSYLGSFSGSIKLGPEFKSGRYHVQFYTNWMNNFPEDESTVQTIEIINENDRFRIDYSAPDYTQINVDFQAEGGNFIEGAMNNLGIKVSDCNGNPLDVKEGKIINSAGEPVANFLVNKMGYAKVYVTPTTEQYKTVFSINGKTVEATLPKAASQGLALEVNNYALPGKTVLKIRTNARSSASLSKKPLFAVIQQNNKSTIFDIGFNNGEVEKELAISNDNLFKGVNTIRIIDSEMNQIAERIICEFPENAPGISLSYSKMKNDTIKIYGQSKFANADLSISVLPENSLASERQNEIFASLLLNPYLTKPILNAAYYLNEPTKAKRYEMDLMLLNQKSGKYNWHDIIGTPPKMTHDFDIGLAIKGTINQQISNPKKYRILLSSPLSLINDYSEINDKNEFNFKNLVFGEAANFKFTLMQIPSVPIEMKFYHQVLNRKRSFNKPFKPQPHVCAPGKQIPLDLPQFAKNIIALENVEIQGKAKSELKYKIAYGNGNLRGYKVSEENNTMSLLSWIGSNGFYVSNYMGNVVISGKMMTTVNGAQSMPDVYVNSRNLTTFDELQDIQMSEVDEIYLNPHAVVASIEGKMGVIKIYLKKMDYNSGKTHTKTYDIKEGFAKIRNYEKPLYLNTADKGFNDFGVIQWVPSIQTDQSGSFSLDIPQTGAKSVTLHIEGFTPDGKFISENKTMAIQ